MRTRIFDKIGPFVIVVHDGIEMHGQEKNGVLFTETGAVKIPECATVTEVRPPKQAFKVPYSHDTPATPFELWQQETKGNFLKENTQAETHDDLKQWHHD